jgi:hypothetical protein
MECTCRNHTHVNPNGSCCHRDLRGYLDCPCATPAAPNFVTSLHNGCRLEFDRLRNLHSERNAELADVVMKNEKLMRLAYAVREFINEDKIWTNHPGRTNDLEAILIEAIGDVT